MARWPGLGEWLDAVRDSPLFAHPCPAGDGDLAPDRVTPLVVHGTRVHLTRHWEDQENVARELLARARREVVGLDPEAAEAALRRIFPGDDGPAADQRSAARTAARRGLAVISGGPGTGKTSTVVRLWALLLEEAASLGQAPPVIQLLTPTGKAAARLVESVRGALAGEGDREVRCEPWVREAIQPQASTIHRALGWRPDRPPRRHAGNPLAADVVVVDEASMVDQGLMAQLVDALPASARLVLLGDRHQLASVEAGAVLADICDAGLPGSVVQLTHSYRFGPDSGIGRLARAINGGHGDEAIQLLQTRPELAWVQVDEDADLIDTIAATVTTGYRSFTTATSPGQRLAALDRFRVLCAHRHGPWGVHQLTPQLERLLVGWEPPVGGRHAHYDGRPLIVTANDHALRLFNGDIGVIGRDDLGESRAFFPAARGELRGLTPARLPGHATVFATTVHRSQGSEYDEVLLVLPSRRSPVVTRELLYTAVTRARRHVTVVGPEAVIREAIASPTQRGTGLGERLAIAAASAP